MPAHACSPHSRSALGLRQPFLIASKAVGLSAQARLSYRISRNARRAESSPCCMRKRARHGWPLRFGTSNEHPDHTIICKGAKESTGEQSKKDDLSISPEVVGSIAVVMGFGVANRVLYKMALNPLSDYVFFLAQFQTFSYVLLYFAVLGYKVYGSKSVGKEQLEVTDKKIFLYIGAAEAASQLLGLIGASKLPGVVIPLLSQTVLIWQIVVGKIVLGRDLPTVQIAGALIVIAGVCLAAFPGNQGASVFSEVSILYAVTYIASMFFPALSAVFKERIFSDAKEKLGGKDLDLFAVNSFGSAAQAGCVFLLLPVISSLRGISFTALPQYLSDGLGCMLGSGEACSAAPLLASAYVFCNLGFNIALLNLLRASSSVIQSLTLSSLVPITIAVFTLNLPYLDDPPVLGLNFVAGSIILSIGLLVYNSNKFLPSLQERFGAK